MLKLWLVSFWGHAQCAQWAAVLVKHAAIAQLNEKRCPPTLGTFCPPPHTLPHLCCCSCDCSAVYWIDSAHTHTHTQIMCTCLTAVHPCASLCLPVHPVPRPLPPPSLTTLQHFGLLKLAINALKHKWIYTHAACCCNPFPFPFPCCMQEQGSMPSPCLPLPHRTPLPPLLGICAAIPFVESQWGWEGLKSFKIVTSEWNRPMKPMEMEQLQCKITWNKWNGTESCELRVVLRGKKSRKRNETLKLRKLYEHVIIKMKKFQGWETNGMKQKTFSLEINTENKLR